MVPRAILLLMMSGLLGACASSGAVPAPFPRPGASAAEPVPESPATGVVTADRTGYGIAGTALTLRGTPYRNGGTDPSGFDCSGLVTYVFAQHGVGMPRTVSEQYQSGRPVPPGQLEPGDLVFFAAVSHGASHVGIAIGGDEFVHAPSGRGEVRVERLSGSYWASRFIGARRVI
jgi:cell wall-associated NlpC family hydrolase